MYDEYNKFTIAFPKIFPHKLYSLTVTLEMNGAEPSGNVSPYVISKNNSGAYGIIDLGAYTTYSFLHKTYNAKIHYLAIGY